MKTKPYVFILTIGIVFLSFNNAFAQQNRKQWQIGAGTGYLQYYGDLSDKFIDNDLFLESKNLFLEKYTTKGTGIRFSYFKGKLSANDRGSLSNKNFERALNFKTDFEEISVRFMFYSDNDKILNQSAFIAPYFSLGVGLVKYEPYADLFDAQGRRYYYWSDNSIRSLDENDPNAANAIMLEQDGYFETKLNPLLTENKSKYNTLALSIPVELGVKFRISNSFNIQLSALAQYTTSDYLDDVSDKPLKLIYNSELAEYAANPANTISDSRGNNNKWNDLVISTNLSLAFSFSDRKTTLRANSILVNSEYQNWLNILYKTDTVNAEKDAIKFDFEKNYVSDSLNKLAITQTYELNINDTAEFFVSAETYYSDSISSISETSKLISGSASNVVDNNNKRQVFINESPIEELNVKTIAAPIKKPVFVISKRDSILVLDSIPSLEKKAIESKPTVQNINNAETATGAEKEKVTEIKLLESNLYKLNEINNNISSISRKIDSLNIIDKKKRSNSSIDSLRGVLAVLQNQNKELQLRTNAGSTYLHDQEYLNAHNDLIKQQQSQLSDLNNRLNSIQEKNKKNQTMQVELLQSDFSKIDYERRLNKTNMELIKVAEALNRIKTKQYSDSVLIKNQSDRILLIEEKLNPFQNDTAIKIGKDTIYIFEQVTVSDSAKLLAIINQLQYETKAIKLELEMQQSLNKVNQINKNSVVNDELENLKTQYIRLLEVEKENQKLKAEIKKLSEKIELSDKQKKEVGSSTEEYRAEIAPYLSKQMFFGFNKSTLDAKYNQIISSYAVLLNKYPSLKIELVGFADKSGNAQYNLLLSEKRANAVKNALLLNNVNPGQIEKSFSGETQSDESNYSSSYFRRVDVKLIEK